VPAWLLKVAAFAVTAMVLIAGTGYVSAHPYNPLAPLRPPLAVAVAPTDALDELLEIPILAPSTPAPTPTPSPKTTPTPRPTVAPAGGVARTGSAPTRAPAAAVVTATTPAPIVAPTLAPTRAPVVVIAPSVRATSKPALTAPHSS